MFGFSSSAHAPFCFVQACSFALSSLMSDDERHASADERSERVADDATGSEVGTVAASPAAGEAPEAALPNAGASAAVETAAPATSTRRKRKAAIDIDEHIATARQKMKEAQRMVSAAKAQARNEKRKKQRLMKKAATLTSEDLERIAVWKRSGLDLANGLFASSRAGSSSHASGASGSSAPASSPVLRAASTPPTGAAGESAAPRPSTGAAA